MDLTKRISVDDAFIKEFEGFIVGSDQIWRPMYSPNFTNFFLDFAVDNQTKIAYAASFGVDKWEIAPALTSIIRNLAKRFDGISVREESGVNLCKDFLGVEAVHVLDPTMLLTAQDYRGLIDKSPEGKDKERYIATYILDRDSRKYKIVNNLSDRLVLPVKRLGEKESEVLQSIEGWLNGIGNADCVITDSFHGTVFSIIFHRPFYTVLNPERGNARIESLLGLFGLKDRIIRDKEIQVSCDTVIDWDKVEARLQSLRLESLSFLQSNLTQQLVGEDRQNPPIPPCPDA